MIALLLLLAAPPLVDASFSVGSSVRRLFFRDRLTPTLAGWQSGALALFGLSVQAYPSTGKLPVVDDIGAYGTFFRSLKNETLTADGALSFDTQETSWELGLRWRAPFGAVSVGYGSLKYDFTGARLPGYLLPAGTVQYWHPEVEGRLRAGPVLVEGGAGYLAVVRQDFLSVNFPRASSHGVDLFARASMELWKVTLHLTGRYTRFFYSLHPEPFDPYVAGGALDEVFALDLACGYRL